MDLQDLAHRVVWTAIEAFSGFVIAEPLVAALGGDMSVSYWQMALASSIAAAVVPVKEFARRQLGKDRTDG